MVTKIKPALPHVPMLYPCKSSWNLPTNSWDMVHTSTFGLKFGSLSPAVTLKIRSRSPKPNQLFIMSKCYIHANLVTIHPPVHAISCKRQQEPHQKQYVPLPFIGGHNHEKIYVCYLDLKVSEEVGMEQHKISDQYLTSGTVSTRSIQRFKKYPFLKTLNKNLSLKFQSPWPQG